MLVRLISLVIDLARFRSGPQDFPYAPTLAASLLLAQLGVLLIRAQLSGAETGEVLPMVLVKGVFAFAAPWLVLRLRDMHARYWQTLLALVSIELLFTLLLLPLVALTGQIDPEAPHPLAPLFGWMALLLMAWLVLISGHIWRHALNLLFPLGVLIALALLLAEGALLVSLFPRPID